MSNTVTNQGKTIDQITSVDTISDESKKAYFIEHGVIPVSGPQGGESSATDKETLGVPMSDITVDVSGKADKVASATENNLAKLDSNGNLADSGIAATSVITSHQDISGKADKAVPSAANNLAKLDSNGNLVDSGIAASAVVTDVSGKADKVVPAAAGNLATLNATGNLGDSGVAATSVITSHQDISGKADKATGATVNNLAKFDSNGNPVDAGISIPTPGTNQHRGDVLTVSNTDELVWDTPQGGGGLPDPTGVTDGYVLTANNNAATWLPAQGGGGSSWSYTKVTNVYFGPKYEWTNPYTSVNYTTRDLQIANHTYTVVPDTVDDNNTSSDNYDTEHVVIHLEQCDFPDAYVQFKTNSHVGYLDQVKVVDSNNVGLTRLYPAGAITEDAVYAVDATLDGGNVDVSVEKDWEEKYWGFETIVQVRIFGDTYTIHSAKTTMYPQNGGE